MLPTRNGAFRLFRALGVDVFVHWSWFVVAYVELQYRQNFYGSPGWNLAEYLCVFGLVLLHEYGHALACRQTGGKADTIILWPLGGVAYVAPPQRPGAQLWSIAAGPLVNVAIAALFHLLRVGLESAHYVPPTDADWWTLLWQVDRINNWLLLFNVLPLYPLDGGQILRSLLWYPFGQGRSLMISAVVGLAGAAYFLWLAFRSSSLFLAAIVLFMGTNCWNAWKRGRAIRSLEVLPRREEIECPQCHLAPPVGPLWSCVRCQQPFDIFAHFAVCPHCQGQYAEIPCLSCQAWSPVADWENTGRQTTPAGTRPVIDASQ